MRGLTQKALAGRLLGRVDYSYIGKIERGEQLPSLKVLQRLADALGVPLGYFFSDEAWTDLLPEEIRRMPRRGPQVSLLRETIRLEPEDIPLVREILRLLVRHRQQAAAGSGVLIRRKKVGDLVEAALPKVAQGGPTYGSAKPFVLPEEAVQAIRKLIRSLRRGKDEELDAISRRLDGILRELVTLRRARGK